MLAYRLEDINHPPRLMQVAVATPQAGEVRLRIAACGLNFADLLMMQGKYQERPSLPFTLGMEVAGTVEAVGAGAALAIGQRVVCFAGQGGLATQGCFDAARCLPLPDAVSFAQAAGFAIAYGTSHLALAHKARLQAGETLLVLGAAGGVGLTAVEIGKRMGARVIASARGAARLAVAQAAGADHLIDSDSADLRGQLKALGGVDVVYDAVGGPAFHEALRATRPEGRLLTIGFAGGEVPQIPANLLLVKNLSVMGLYWGGYLQFAPKVLLESLQTLLGWIAQGQLHPHIGQQMPLSQVAEAYDLLRNRSATGKIVITMPDAPK